MNQSEAETRVTELITIIKKNTKAIRTAKMMTPKWGKYYNNVSRAEAELQELVDMHNLADIEKES